MCSNAGLSKYHARIVQPGPISFSTSWKFHFTCPMYKVNTILYFIFWFIVMSSLVALKAVWILISWLLQKPADLDLHCLQESWYLISYCFQKSKWAMTWDFQQCGMCDQQRLRPAWAYAQSDQSLCLSLEYSITVKLLAEHHLEFLSFKGGSTGSSESVHVKMPHCLKSHVAAQIV